MLPICSILRIALFSDEMQAHPVLLCTVVFIWLAVNFFRRENSCVSVRGFLDTCVCCEIARSVLRSVQYSTMAKCTRPAPPRPFQKSSTSAPPHTITHIHTVLPQPVAGPRHTSIISGNPKVSSNGCHSVAPVALIDRDHYMWCGVVRVCFFFVERKGG